LYRSRNTAWYFCSCLEVHPNFFVGIFLLGARSREPDSGIQLVTSQVTMIVSIIVAFICSIGIDPEALLKVMLD